jgi:hypothetical protein
VSCHLPYHMSSPSIATPIHPASKCSQQWWWSLLPPSLYYLLSISAVSSAKSCIIPIDSYPHPPYKQMLTAVVVVLLTIVITQCQHSTHSPPHKQLLEGLDAGSVLSAVLPRDSIVSNGVMDKASRSAYLAGIPLHGSSSTPLLPVTFSVLSIPMASHPTCMGRRGLGVYIQSLVCTCAIDDTQPENPNKTPKMSRSV